MSKKLALINDLSGFGRCSLTAAISVTSAMGVQACPLPTAILSNQTGFPSYVCHDFTEQMKSIQDEWSKNQAVFDGIYTGFVSHESQLDQILDFVSTFHIKDSFLLVDPIMGDNGKTFSFVTDALKTKMKSLAEQADIITPNLTEFCLLTDSNYDSLTEYANKDDLLNQLECIGHNYCINGPTHIIITGIKYMLDDGINYIGNSYISKSATYHVATPYLGASFSGTGDLFASCIAAGVARGENIPILMDLASNFIQQAIQDSVEKQIPYREGVNFEAFLHLLYKSL